VITHETEGLVVPATSGDLHRSAVDAGYSAARGTILEANAAGDSVTYSMYVPQARTYNVRVGVKKLNNRGIWQLESNGIPHGAPVDGFAAAAAFTEAEIGAVTFTTAGVKSFRFRVTGKNPSSTGFWVALDYVRLTPM
jgi:hypothetical protein